MRGSEPSPLIIGTVGVLAVLASVFDSLSLVTFIPLIRTLTQASGAAWTSLPVLNDVERLGLAGILAVLCGLVVLKNICDIAIAYLIKRAEGAVAFDLRGRIMEATMRTAVERTAQHGQADILSILTDSSWKAATAMAHRLKMIVAGTAAAVLLATMLAISPRLTLVAFVLLGCLAIVVRGATRVADRTGRAVVEQNKVFGNRMLENLTSLQMIRAFGNEQHELGRFAQESQSLRRRILRLDLLWSLPGPAAEISVALTLATLIAVGMGIGVEVPALVAFLSLLFRVQAPLRNLIENKLARDGLKGSVDDVAGFLDTAGEQFAPSGTRFIEHVAREIRFDRVGFRYGPDRPWALRDVSFTIDIGKTTGIVGGSGAGKSTIMLLLFRFIEPVEGQILVDGIPLRDLEVAAWRRHLALMSQEVHLLNATVRENIAYGDLSAGQDRIEQAAHVAGVDAAIRALPEGYASQVGTAGFRLSGGQRQRVALARAILRNPDILLLDEATNALDAEAEAHFNFALEAFGAGRTVVAIAHRLASVARADHLIVLEQGRVVEQGTPAELLAMPGRFADLHKLQTGALVQAARDT